MTGPTRAVDTIFALSSGSLPAAIAVVRLSGPDAGSALARLAGRMPPARRATMAVLNTNAGMLLDRGLVLWLPGPDSATGEDLVELHLHGGRATVAAVLEELGRIPGLRGAEAGEFTRRALLNGRLDLAQVEGLADLLAAETEGQRRAALRMAEGGLGRLIAGWREQLLHLSAAVEASIEYAEENEGVPSSLDAVRADAARLADAMAGMAREPPAERLRDGVRIVIAGPVNAGKSTLLNALAGRDAAIASPIEGTTRDLIEVPLMFHRHACVLIDGAGLRAADDPIERMGIERVEAAIETADLLLWLGAPEDCPDVAERLILHAQADRRGPDHVPAGVDLSVSALTGSGLPALRDLIADRVRSLLPREETVAVNARHRSLLDGTARDVRDAALQTDELLLAEDLRHARGLLDQVTGAAATEQMLDALFGRFCIGK